jgi:hypothetical protein
MAHLTRVIETMMLMCNLKAVVPLGSVMAFCLKNVLTKNAHMKDWNSIEKHIPSLPKKYHYKVSFFFILCKCIVMKSKTIFINKTKIASTDGL